MIPGDPGTTPATPKTVKEQKESLIDADEVIYPLTFPEPPVTPEYVNSMASGLRTIGESISQTGNSITSAWSGLTTCYSAPEAETLHAVLDPIAPDGEEVSGGLADAATALETFASEVEGIKERWSSLRSEAYDLRARIAAEGEDWRKADGRWDRIMGNESPLVAENQELIDKGGRIIDDYTEIENACANAINKEIPHRTGFEKYPEGEADLDPNVFYHGFEQDLSELATEWGVTGAGTDHGWWIDAGAATWDFGVGAVEGVGAMVGAHSSQGWFQQSWGDSLKEYHWDNLTSAASLVGLYDTETGEFGRASADSVKGAWKDLAHSVVPWEEWGERPGYVIGTALLNIGATVGGAVLTATGVGAVVGVPLMAWRGMAILDGMGGSNRGGGVDLPNLPDMPTYGGNGAPVVNIDTSNMTPTQVAQVTASLDRLNTATSDSTSGGSGRPSQPGSSPEPETNKPRKPTDNSNQEPTTRQAQLGEDVFERVISPEDRAELTARGQAIEQEFGVSRRDSDTEIPSRGSDSGFDNHPDAASVSDRLNRVSDEWRSDAQPESRGRELVGAAARGNDSHLEQSGSNHDRSGEQNLNLTNIDGDRSGHRSTNDIGSNNSNSPQVRDHNPTARNSQGDATTPDRNSAPQDTSDFSRNSNSGPTTSHTDGDGPTSRRDTPVQAPTGTGPNLLSDHQSENRSGLNTGHSHGNTPGPNDPGRNGRDTDSEERRSWHRDKVTQTERWAAVKEILGQGMWKTKGEFEAKFLNDINSHSKVFDILYMADGRRWDTGTRIFGDEIPTLYKDPITGRWESVDKLPSLDRAGSRLKESGRLYDRDIDDIHLPKLDFLTRERMEATQALDNASADDLSRTKAERNLTTEVLGEAASESAVHRIFDGKTEMDLKTVDQNGGVTYHPTRLPELTGGNLLDMVKTAPDAGNLQFDQVFPCERDGKKGFIIVEAKGDTGLSLKDRKVTINGKKMLVWQGSQEYKSATLSEMISRGNVDPRKSGPDYVNEGQLALEMMRADANDMLFYVKVKARTSVADGGVEHGGFSFDIFD